MRPPTGHPSNWQLCDMLATEIEQWVAWLDAEPDGYRKIRSLMYLRGLELRRAPTKVAPTWTVHSGLVHMGRSTTVTKP